MSEPTRNRRFIPRRTGDATPLGELETAVMQIVWTKAGPIPVGDVHASLAQSRRTAYTTVKTTMERLAEKRILTRRREGKAYVYRAAVSRDELERRIVSQALDRLVEQFPSAVASFFARPDPAITDERLALLQEAIERSRADHDA